MTMIPSYAPDSRIVCDMQHTLIQATSSNANLFLGKCMRTSETSHAVYLKFLTECRMMNE